MKVDHDEDLPLLAWRPPATVHPFPPARWRGFILREARRIAALPAHQTEREVARAVGNVGLRLVGLQCNQFVVGKHLDTFEDALKFAIIARWEETGYGDDAA